MKCPKCGGKGKTTEYDGLRKFWCDYKCEMCNGTGEVMTEQEWLQTCDTEHLADVLLEHFEWGLSINAEYCFTEKYVEQNREHILEWLKQPHTQGEAK